MLICYGNTGAGTIYFKTQLTEPMMFFFVNLIINFVIPFFVLIRNDTKRKVGTIVFSSIILLFGHWLDFFLMVKPGVKNTYQNITGSGIAGASSDSSEAVGAMVADGDKAEYTFVVRFNFMGVLDIGVFLV